MIGDEPQQSQPFGGILTAFRKSPVTWLLVAINVAMFLILTITGGSSDTVNLYRWGAKFGPAIQAGDWYRLFYPIVLHAGMFHIAANTFALVIFGPRLELEFGRWAYLATYVVAGVCGVAVSYLVSPTLSVGASGAIFGLVGAYGMFLLRNRKDFGASVNPVIVNLAIVLVINIVFGLIAPGIDQGAHVGGLIAGAAMGFFVGPRRVVDIEDDFYIFGAPTVRTYFKKADISRVAVASTVGLLIALAISWWVTNNVEYDAATLGVYGYYELATR